MSTRDEHILEDAVKTDNTYRTRHNLVQNLHDRVDGLLQFKVRDRPIPLRHVVLHRGENRQGATRPAVNHDYRRHWNSTQGKSRPAPTGLRVGKREFVLVHKFSSELCLVSQTTKMWYVHHAEKLMNKLGPEIMWRPHAIGACLSPFLGGVLTHFSWHSCFLLSMHLKTPRRICREA